MITNTASTISHSKNGKKNFPALRKLITVKVQGDAMFSKRRILKWFGTLSTLLIVAAAVAPGNFGIPLGLRPWVFLTSIFWLLAFCSGFSNS